MQITITLSCPDWQGTKVVKNGIKPYGKQNYLCKDCHRQFIDNYNLTYKGCLSMIYQKILILLAEK